MTDKIPFIDLQAQRRRLGKKIDIAIAGVLEHGGFIMGPEVKELEARLAEYCGARHAISCASGTDALLMPLMAWGVGPGDAVFCPAFTFVATAEVVSLAGATPVFVDVLAGDFNMDPASLERAIEACGEWELQPKVVIPVDLFGQPADYGRILPIAEKHGLKVLSDTAQGFGAVSNGARTGTFGDATATSFFPAKPLGCYGDGGAVFTDDDGAAETMRSVRVHGQGSHKYENVRIGINGRLDTLQAAVLLEKLAIFDDEISARQRIAEQYNEGLKDVARVPNLMPGRTSSWAQYTLILENRDRVAKALGEAGIPTAIYYPIPLSRQKGYQDCPAAPGGIPVSEELSGQVLSLPMHPYLEESIQQRIIAQVREAVEG